MGNHKILPEFVKLGKFQIDKFNSQSYDPETREKLFSAKKAVYHKNCFSKFNQHKLLHAQRAFEIHLNDSHNELVRPKRARRSDPSSKILLGELKCLFVWNLIPPSLFVLLEHYMQNKLKSQISSQHVRRNTNYFKNLYWGYDNEWDILSQNLFEEF